MRVMKNRQAGFTLIEIIITLVVMSIAGTMLVSFMGTSLTQSADPLSVLDDNCEIGQALEAINVDYRARLESNSSQDMSFYEGDLTKKEIYGIPAGVSVVGKYVSFSDPDDDRKVDETTVDGPNMYVKVTASKNDSTLVTIIGN